MDIMEKDSSAKSLQQLIDEFILGNSSAINEIIKGIYDGHIKLSTIVELLGPYLTSVEHEKRLQGMKLLSEVLQMLSMYKMQATEVQLLVAFYSDRLQDHFSILPETLRGILALVQHQIISEEDAVTIVKGIFKEVQNQALLQADRNKVYAILAGLLDKHYEGIKIMDADFVFGYIQVMDGEKDPRNLLLALKIAKFIVQNFNIDLFLDDFFEIISCYFPIDFTPPPNLPSNESVTKEDLIIVLRESLTSTRKFAGFLLPMLLDKLSSDVQSAKLDSLQTMVVVNIFISRSFLGIVSYITDIRNSSLLQISCAKIYTATDFQEYLQPIWTAIRQEVFLSMDDQVQELSLEALKHVVVTISSNSLQQPDQDPLNDFINMIVTETQQYLQDPELKLANPCGNVLNAVASASDRSCYSILTPIIPRLVNLYSTDKTVIFRCKVLDILIKLLNAAANCQLSEQFIAPMDWHEIVKLLQLAMDTSEEDIRLRVTASFSILIQIKDALPADEIERISNDILKRALEDPSSIVRHGSISTLATIASVLPDVIITTVIPYIRTSGVDESFYNILAVTSLHLNVMKESIPMLIQMALNSMKTNEDSLHSTFEALHKITESNVKNRIENCLYLYHYLFDDILWLCVYNSLEESINSFEFKTIKIIASIGQLIYLNLDESSQKKFIDNLLELFMNGQVSVLKPMTVIDELPLKQFYPLNVASSQRQVQLIEILCKILGAIKFRDGILSPNDMITNLLDISCKSVHQPSATSASQLLSSIINKMEEGDQLENYIKSITNTICNVLYSKNVETEMKNAVNTWIWLMKALIMRSHPYSNEALIQVLKFFKLPNVGHVASAGFKIIIGDEENILCESTNAIVKFMYKNRFFMMASEKLMENYRIASKGIKHHYLTALSHLLNGVPKQMLLNHLQMLMPLLVESVSCDEESLRLSSLQTLRPLITEAPDIISNYVASMLPELLKLCNFPSSMKIRISALQSVNDLASLPIHLVVPYKSKVINELGNTVNDKKRLVFTVINPKKQQ
ncbi:MMS19 nucleotide excision repair protein-like protein [Trichoplax sp. H2]|nr:MMS19 nucleotide excision repair protein-like protein [Trichoplax sp. H2]|eukprot:RDD38774.1 MMS19 nucleotide excision repair protein-like protein [Trichoplax sp. H2]